LSRRRILQTTAAVSGLLATDLTAATTEPAIENGRTTSVYADDDVIREDYWVETSTDTDGSGSSDRVHVEIARPASTNQTELSLPVIVTPSPYYGGINRAADGYSLDTPLYSPTEEPQLEATSLDTAGGDLGRSTEDLLEFTGSDEHTATDGLFDLLEFGVDVQAASEESSIGPSAYEEQFLPHGYVFAYVSSLGTGLSTGCPTAGGPDEIAALKAVVDWLNRRATAYRTPAGKTTAKAPWTDGTTGMLGKSYNGTLATGVATTGVDGLETIVPISAISSWYNYYRSEGAVINPTSAPAATQRGRGQAMDADVIAESVLTRDDADVCDPVIDRLTQRQDRPSGEYNDFWEARDYRRDVENMAASVLLAHGVDDHNVKPRNASALAAELYEHDVPHKIWLTQGGHTDPRFLHEQQWFDELNQWFAHWLLGVDNGIMDGDRATVQRRDSSGPLQTYADWPDPGAEAVELNFAPGGRKTGGLRLENSDETSVQETLVDSPRLSQPKLAGAPRAKYRLRYLTESLQESIRLSGTVQPTLRLSFDSGKALVTAVLVDYAPEDSPALVSQGWVDPQNNESLRESEALEPGKKYDLEFPLQATDHVFEAGHRLGIMVHSSDYNTTKRPPHNPELTLHLDESSVELPVVGGRSALESAVR
jgi:X-Pro dipeptidyl-peptidase